MVADGGGLFGLDPTAGIVDGLIADVVASNLETAKPVVVPSEFEQLVREYAKARPADGKLLKKALGRTPQFYSGGWLVVMQSDVAAVTLDSSVFIADAELELLTYVHELVHVAQFTNVGSSAFLRSYFGGGALEVLRRLAAREPADIVTSGPEEKQAYRIEQRFLKWLRKNRATVAKRLVLD